MAGDPATRYRVRAAEPNDATAIVELFQRSFKAPYDLETWRWKYQQSPWARPELSLVAQRDDGEIVGHLGAMMQPLNLLGRSSVLAQVVDAMVDPRNRGSGMFGALFAAWIAEIERAGIVVTVGFPNEHSLRALHRAIPLVAILEKCYLPLGGAHHDRLRLRVGTAPERTRLDFEFDPDYELDARYDPVWQSCSEQESLSIRKDREYLRWKYGAAPTPHQLFALHYAGQLMALAVCRERDHRVHLLDLIALDKSYHAARALVLAIADYYLARKFAELRFLGRDPWFFAEVFADFERRPGFWGHVYARATSRNDAFLYENPMNWTLVSSDSDV